MKFRSAKLLFRNKESKGTKFGFHLDEDINMQIIKFNYI